MIRDNKCGKGVDLCVHIDNRGMGWESYACNCSTGTSCNPAAIKDILKSANAAEWLSMFPEMAAESVELPNTTHWVPGYTVPPICQPTNNTVEDNSYCPGTQFIDVPQSAFRPWGIAPPTGSVPVKTCN